MSHQLNRDAVGVFLTAFLVRLIAVVMTTVTSVNSYAQYDADGFAATASWIASTIATGSVPVLDLQEVHHVWGAMLAPFWFVPGPSRIYARIGMAVLGSLAVYNVYVIARYYHSKRAGAVAVLPLIVFPSFLFIHASLLREAMVLFGLTTVARLLLAPSSRLGPLQQYALSLVLLTPVVLLRRENLPVYLLVVVLAGIVSVEPWRRYPDTTKAVAGIGTVLSLPVGFVYGRSVVNQLAGIRRKRARGDAVYLGWVFPETILEAIAFSWIGAAYFLFAPFPWMVAQVQDLVVMVEGLINVVYTIAAVYGTRVLATRTIAGTTALVVGVVLGAVLYGLANANFGAAVRQRQMVLWVLFLFGGIGIADYVEFRAGDRRP